MSVIDKEENVLYWIREPSERRAKIGTHLSIRENDFSDTIICWDPDPSSRIEGFRFFKNCLTEFQLAMGQLFVV